MSAREDARRSQPLAVIDDVDRRQSPRRRSRATLGRLGTQLASKRRAVAAGLGMAALVPVLGAGAARAGTYVIDNCPAAPAHTGDPGPWTVFGAPQSSKVGCAGSLNDYIAARGGEMSPGSSAGVEVSAPSGSGITIREAKVWWYVPHQSSGADTFALAYADGGIVGESTTPVDWSTTPDDFVLPSQTRTFMLSDYCSNDYYGRGCAIGPGQANDLQLFGAELTLGDSSLPSGQVSGGGLAGSGPVSGTQALTYSASDSGSGVRAVSLLIDGTRVAQNDYLARCPYANFLACPPSVGDTFTWNTATAASGQHRVEVVAESAAHNDTVIYDGTTVVGAPNGNGASDSAQIHLGMRDAIYRSFARRSFTIRGRLVDGRGQPIGAASLDVLQDLGAARVIAHASTAADGSFSAHVPPGPSRVVEVAYRAFSSDPGYAAQATVRESVRAGAQLAVSPRVTSPTGTIVLSGRVLGQVPRRGVLVELLVRYLGSWQPLRTPRTDSSGRFRVAYQFQGALGSFPFRVEVPDGQAGFAFATGYSPAVSVSTR
jgi:hypothetical protein